MNKQKLIGCWIDGAIPRNDAEYLLKLLDLLAEVDPRNKLLCELDHLTPTTEFEEGLADEYINEVIAAIESRLPEELFLIQEAGDVIITDESEDNPIIEIEQYVSCPTCNGFAAILGTLGNKTHYACRDCGMQFYKE